MHTEQLLEDMLDKPVELDKPSEYPFHVGEYDEIMLERIKKKTPSWRKVVERREPEFKEFDKLMSSIFLDLWKPTNIEVAPLTDSATIMAQLLEIAHSMPEWQRLYDKVNNKYGLSAVAAVTIGEHIQIPEGDSGGGGQGEDEGNDDQDTSSQGGGDSGIDDATRDAMMKAVREAEKAADDADTMAQLWGSEEGEHVEDDPETLLKLLKTLQDSSRLKIVVQMLGRLKNQFRHTRMTRSQYIPEEFVDIELGDDLSNILPYSMLPLADEDLEVLFWMDYIQKSLLQQVKEGREPLDLGPIVMMIDVSGSMSSPMGTVPGVGNISRLDWALAIALTMILLAKQQNRDYYIGMFDYYMQKELRSADGPVTLETIINLLSVRAGGGTSFDKPLQKGLDVMLESKYNKADMVFVTDGECRVNPTLLDNFQTAKKEREFRVLGVACASVDPGSLAGFCDKTLSVKSVFDADTASKHIFSLGE